MRTSPNSPALFVPIITACVVATAAATSGVPAHSSQHGPVVENQVGVSEFLGNGGGSPSPVRALECAEENQIVNFDDFYSGSNDVNLIRSFFDRDTGFVENVRILGEDDVRRVIEGSWEMAFVNYVDADHATVVGYAGNLGGIYPGLEGFFEGYLYSEVGDGNTSDAIWLTKDANANGYIACVDPTSGKVTFDPGDWRFTEIDLLFGNAQVRADHGELPWYSSQGSEGNHTTIPKILIDKFISPICGDVNLDEKVLAHDALETLRESVGIETGHGG